MPFRIKLPRKDQSPSIMKCTVNVSVPNKVQIIKSQSSVNSVKYSKLSCVKLKSGSPITLRSLPFWSELG